MAHPSEPLSSGSERLQAHVLDARTALAALTPEWQALFNDIGTGRWCCAPQVVAQWIATLRLDRETSIVAVRDGQGRLRGVMALMHDRVWRGPAITPRFDYDPQDRDALEHQRLRPFPVRQISAPASLPATMLWTGPLCHPQDREAVLSAIGRALEFVRDWDVAVFATPQDQAGSVVDALAPAGRARVQPLGRVAMSISNMSGFEEILSRQSGKFRQNMRRARKFGDAAGLEISLVEGREPVRQNFALIQDLARKSWKHDGRPGTQVNIPYDARQRAFFEGVMGSQHLDGVPALVIARDADGPVAVLTLLALGHAVSSLLTFWDGRHARASPGLQIMGRGIDWAAARGARCYDLNATAEWVRPLADTFTPIANVTLFRRTLRGQAFSTLSGTMARIRR